MPRILLLMVLVTSFQAAAAPRPNCGQLMRPLDPSGRVPGTIPIVFAI
jgi:hypothetical protein